MDKTIIIGTLFLFCRRNCSKIVRLFSLCFFLKIQNFFSQRLQRNKAKRMSVFKIYSRENEGRLKKLQEGGYGMVSIIIEPAVLRNSFSSSLSYGHLSLTPQYSLFRGGGNNLQLPLDSWIFCLIQYGFFLTGFSIHNLLYSMIF